MSTQRQTFVFKRDAISALIIIAALQGCNLQLFNGSLDNGGGPVLTEGIGDEVGEEQIVSGNELTAGQGPDSVVMEDLDADGDIDIATTNLQSNNVGIFLNNGVSQGSVQFGLRHYTAGYAPSGLRAGDMDRDGDIDLVATSVSEDVLTANITVLFNDGAGQFTSGSLLQTADGGLASMEVGDLDGDGSLDIASMGHEHSNTGSTPAIFVLYGLGSGGFSSHVPYVVNGPSYGLALGDLNGDGLLDMANSNTFETSVSVHLNQGQRSFAPQVTYQTGLGAQDIVLADLTGDGSLDLITTVTNELDDPSELNSDTVVILENNGAGQLDNITYLPTGHHPFALAALDLNGDSQIDIAVTNAYEEYASIFLNQSGVFAEEQTLPVGLNPFSVAGQDLDGSGGVDLVIANRMSGTLSVFFDSFGSGDK